MKMVIDTNIVLDVLLEREEFCEKSEQILEKCASKEIEGYITASTATDIFYIINKALKDKDEAYKAMDNIVKILGVLTVTDKDIIEALEIKHKDFEDCLLSICAKNNNCDGIITRNEKDFIGLNIQIYTPSSI